MSRGLGWASPYLTPDRSGVGYLLDPDAECLPDLVRQRRLRTPDSPCDPEAVEADLRLLPDLLGERHFGIATRIVSPRARDEAFESVLAAADRVTVERPRTWGAAIGDLCDRLRTSLVDRHVHIAGAPRSAIRATDPTLGDDPGPAVQVDTVDGALVVRLRSLVGGVDDDTVEAWVEGAATHFRSWRILVDLRGNTGGDDGYTLEWMEAAGPRGGYGVSSEEWRVGEAWLGLWNSTVVACLTGGASARHADALRPPAPGDRLRLLEEADEAMPASASAETGWRGSMLVLTDARTGSSGESSAWFLRERLGAALVGGATFGSIEYGNIAPCCLPHGLWIGLPTKHNRFRVPVELVGVQPDLALDPTLPTTYYARNFDHIYARARRQRADAHARQRPPLHRS